MKATELVGRDADLRALRELLERGSRLITIIGPPGVGKTTLARVLVEPWAAEHEGYRVVSVDASQATDEPTFLAELARATGAGQPATKIEAQRSIVEASLGVAPTLLFIDNLDELSEPLSARLASFLDGDGELIVLVTSRRTLGLDLENVFELAPWPMITSAGELGRSPAAQLFLRTARRKQRAFEVAPEHEPALIEILNRLEGVPLAIELAAFRVPTLSLPALAERLRESHAVLFRQRGGDPRHASLTSAYATMLSTTDEAAASAFAQCAVFRVGFSVQAFEAVIALPEGEVPLDVLHRLVERSLVVADPFEGSAEERRFRLLASAKEFAAQIPQNEEVRAAIRRRHLGHYVLVAERMHTLLVAGRYGEAVSVEEREHENFRDALDSCVAFGDDASARKMLIPLVRACRFSMRPFVYESWYEKYRSGSELDALRLEGELLVAEAFSTPEATLAARARVLLESDLTPPRTRARARSLVASALASTGKGLDALSLLVKATAAEDEYERLSAATDLSHALHIIGQSAEARRYAEGMLAELPFESDRHPDLSINALINLSLLHLDCGDRVAAEQRIAEGLRRVERAGITTSRAAWILRVAKARLAHIQGNLDVAQQGYQEEERTAKAIGLPLLGGLLGGYEGIVMIERGQVVAGADRLREALFISSSVQPLYVGFLEAMLSLTELARGELDAAISRLDAAERRVPPGSPFRRVVDACRGVAERVAADRDRAAGRVDLATGREERARTLLAELFDRPKQLSLFELFLTERLLSLETRLPASPPTHSYLVMASDGRWFTPPAGERVICGRRPVMRRMLVALARTHIGRRGGSMAGSDLVAAGWPNERMGAESARRRLQVMMSRMRELGLKSVLQTTDEGYRIDPDCVITLRDEE